MTPSLRTLAISASLLCAAPSFAQQPLGTFAGAVRTLEGESGLSGTAIACVSDSDPREVDTFVLLRGQMDIQVMLVIPTPAPQAREYDLDPYGPGGESAPIAELRVPEGNGLARVYRVRSGTLRLATASADQVQGSVEFLAQNSRDPNDAMRAAFQFTAEHVGGMIDGDCVRPAGAAAPSPAVALAGAQVAPGTAALVIRHQDGITNATGTADFCRAEEGLEFGVYLERGGLLMVNTVPPRPGRFSVGSEDNEVFVSLRPEDGLPAWVGSSGFVRITSVEAGRVQANLDVRVRPIGSDPQDGYVELAAVIDAMVHPRCAGR